MTLKEIVKLDLEKLRERQEQLERDLFYIKNEIKLRSYLQS